MAAMRLGCLFSHPANIAYLHKAQSPYSVNTLAVLAAQAAVRGHARTSKRTSPKCWPRASCSASAWRSSASPTSPAPANFVLGRFRQARHRSPRRTARPGHPGARPQLRSARLRAHHRRHARADAPLAGRAGGDLETMTNRCWSSTWTASWWTSPNRIARPSRRPCEHFTGVDAHARADSGLQEPGRLERRLEALPPHDHRGRASTSPFEDVKDYFQQLFLGNGDDGLIQREQWVARPGMLEQLARAVPTSPSSPAVRSDEADITLRPLRARRWSSTR